MQTFGRSITLAAAFAIVAAVPAASLRRRYRRPRAARTHRGYPLHAEGLLRLNRTRGALLWMRAHFDGRLRVEIRAAEPGSCVVLVRRGDEPIRETRLVAEADGAREPADAILLEAFPHDCRGEECGAWVEMNATKR